MSGINQIGGIGRQKRIQELSGIQNQGAATRVAQNQPQVDTAQKGDQVNLSDEVKKPEQSKNVDLGPLKDNIKAARQMSGDNKQVGMVKGTQEASNISSRNGITKGFEQGMNPGAVYSSRRN
ncbi:MAG: hypothetical protein ACLFQV_12305 [Vulcanimicrobiota bacterium]